MTTLTIPSHRLPMNCSTSSARIADHDDARDSVQADARRHLRYLEAASSGSLTGETPLTMAASDALQRGREVVQRIPRPRFGTA